MRFNDYHVACHPYQVPITLPLSPRSQARSVAAAAEGEAEPWKVSSVGYQQLALS